MFTASMSRRKLVLVIEPVEDICFTGPRDMEIFSNIRLTNPSYSKVALIR